MQKSPLLNERPLYMKSYFWNFEWYWIQIDTCVGNPYWRPFTHHNIITFHFPHNSFFEYASMCLVSSTNSWINHISFFMYAFLFCMIFVFADFIAVRSLVYHFQFLMHIIYKKEISYWKTVMSSFLLQIKLRRTIRHRSQITIIRK